MYLCLLVELVGRLSFGVDDVFEPSLKKSSVLSLRLLLKHSESFHFLFYIFIALTLDLFSVILGKLLQNLQNNTSVSLSDYGLFYCTFSYFLYRF